MKHRIYITIDDHPTTTSMAMLSLLKRCKIKATFFLVGISEWYYQKNPRYKPLRQRHKSLVAIHKAGHVLGNHTVTHRNLCKLTRSKVRWELQTTQRLIKKATGVTPKYWRPPFMASCRVARQEAAKLGLQLVWAHVDDLHGSAKTMWRHVRRRSIRQGKKSTIVLIHKNVKKFKAFLELTGLCSPSFQVRSRKLR